MRSHLRQLIDDAARRTASPGSAPLGAEAVRLARLAASIHMTQAAGLLRPAAGERPGPEPPGEARR
ncbi:MAG: hypothetical protein ACYTG1_06715 [Planctomycetota bacterium]